MWFDKYLHKYQPSFFSIPNLSTTNNKFKFEIPNPSKTLKITHNKGVLQKSMGNFSILNGGDQVCPSHNNGGSSMTKSTIEVGCHYILVVM